MGIMLLCHLYDLCLILGPLYTCCTVTEISLQEINSVETLKYKKGEIITLSISFDKRKLLQRTSCMPGSEGVVHG